MPANNIHVVKKVIIYTINKAVSASTVVVFVIIAALVVDTSLIKISDFFIRTPEISTFMIGVFVAIGIIYVIGQSILLKIVKLKSNEPGNPPDLYIRYMHKLVIIVQYILIVILVFVILEILLTSYYSTIVLILATAISYALAITMMGLLTQRFLSWFKSNRNFVVLLYGLSSVTFAINAAFTLALVISWSPSLPLKVGQQIADMARFIVTGSLAGYLNYGYVASSIASFMLMWCATAMLLAHYSKRLGRIVYWIIISIPLAYFLSQFITSHINLFESLLISNPTFFGTLLTLIFTLTNLAGGILFGVAFWIVAKSLQRDSIVRNYMIISAYGLVLLFVSNQAIVFVSVPFPPFGLVTISFTGLSSYLILIGIYSAAVSVSQDVKLRKSVRKIAVNELKLLDSIGTAEMQEKIQKKVMIITKENRDNMIEETGVSPSLTEEDIKSYLDEVLQEVKDRSRK
jgi:hypothetical protein